MNLYPGGLVQEDDSVGVGKNGGSRHVSKLLCGRHGKRERKSARNRLSLSFIGGIGGSALDILTVISSHELCEAVTNPDGQGWYDPNTGNEIGDICAPPTAGAGGTFRIGNDLVQEEWSKLVLEGG